MTHKKIIFEDFQFECVICLNANLPGADFFSRLYNCEIIAADGAALKLLDIGINSDFIIGDLDSFNSDPRKSYFENSKIIHIPDQDTNDFEKILIWCIENNRNNLMITGMHGGELEHTLNNWSILMRYSLNLNLCVYDAGRYGIPISESIEFLCRIGEIISIIPLNRVLLSSENLKWELNNTELEFGKNEGARNQSTKEFVKIFVHSGIFLLFLDSKAPKCPKFL